MARCKRSGNDKWRDVHKRTKTTDENNNLFIPMSATEVEALVNSIKRNCVSKKKVEAGNLAKRPETKSLLAMVDARDLTDLSHKLRQRLAKKALT